MDEAESPVLLLGDGDELADVAALLRSLGVPFEERKGDAAAGPFLLPRDLLVATGRRGLALPPPPARREERRGPARLAVITSDSPSLRSGLRGAGFGLLVCRPVHPTALRLLLLRLLYRGPERRRELRVAVGMDTRFRLRLFWRRAILTELSTQGGRLLVSRPLRPGRRLLLEVPDPGAPGSALRVSARVVRSNPLGPTEPGFSLALEFPRMDEIARAGLERIVKVHEGGPASMPQGWRLEEPLGSAVPQTSPWQPGSSQGEGGPEPEIQEGSSAPGEAERRRHPRPRYGARVVTLGEEAAHVVMGRDLSEGGIRIEPHGGLERGQRLALALHGGSLPVPLVVRGVVDRDDGDQGLVIRFESLGPAQREALQKLTCDLGGIENLASGSLPGRSVVTRIVPPGEAAASS